MIVYRFWSITPPAGGARYAFGTIYPSDTIYEYDMFAGGERFLFYYLKHLPLARIAAELDVGRAIFDLVALYLFIE